MKYDKKQKLLYYIIIIMYTQGNTTLNRPISQYINKQNSLLEQALTYIPGSLPQPIPILENNLNLIPLHMRNISLHREIHGYNKKLIGEEFMGLCQQVMRIYDGFRGRIKGDCGGFYASVGKMLAGYQGEDSLYVRNLMTENEVQFVRRVLRNIAISHVQYFALNTNSGKNQYISSPIKIPQKYEQIISQKINRLIQPSQMNYFEELIINPQTKHEGGFINKLQIKAEQTAAYLTSMFNQRHSVDAKQITNRQKNVKPTESVLIFQPFVISHGSKKKVQQPQSAQVYQTQNILNNLVTSIQNQQLNSIGYPELTESETFPQMQFDNWFTNTFSQMTFYESYMMAHMADLIFLNPDKFQIKYIKYDPYLGQLHKQVKEEIGNFKSEQEAFNILYQSKYKPLQKQVSMQTDQKAQKDKKTNKITLGKAIGAIQDIYQKAKKQLKKNQKSQSKQNQSFDTSFDRNKFLVENQNLLIPAAFKTTKNHYQAIIRDLQNFNRFLHNVHESEHIKPHGGLFQSIKVFAQELKNKFNEQNMYYHELQSWMAIVIILYKQIAMDKNNNFDYNPFKRRCIIRICKRIFIQQKKISKNKKEKPVNQQNPFKNWPVVLKFLENNRPEILFDAQGSTNEKQVDKILKQLYQAIEKKKLLESGFGHLFQGIENIKQSLPQIKLVCLSNGSSPNENLDKGKTTTQCKVVHILISGFLSEDTDKLQEWSEMVDIMSDSQIYALVWQSNTIKNLVKFALKSAADVIGAVKMIDELRRKYTDNPFNPAFEVAQITGRILAELIIRLFPNRFVNVCGYSLGSQVIKQFLNRMVVKKQTHLINNMYIMGGVSDCEAIADLVSRSQTPLSLYNCYTNNDSVLRHLLSLCKPDIKPVGLHQVVKIQGHSIINVNCTKFISGHLAFRSNLRLMGEILQLSTG